MILHKETNKILPKIMQKKYSC
jgi:hypothetical protein